MNIKEQLQSAIDYCNTKLASKGVTEPATSVVDIGNKIENIQGEDAGVGSYIDKASSVTYHNLDLFGKTEIILNLPNCFTLENLLNVPNSSSLPNGEKRENTIVKKITINCLKPIMSIKNMLGSNSYYDQNVEHITLNVDLSKTIKALFAFNNAKALKTIDGTPLNFTSVKSNLNFVSGCNLLEHIRFAPNSIFISTGLPDSKNLTNESIQSIIDGLTDLTGQTAQTLTLHTDVKSKLTQEQIAQITSKNWTLA